VKFDSSVQYDSRSTRQLIRSNSVVLAVTS